MGVANNWSISLPCCLFDLIKTMGTRFGASKHTNIGPVGQIAQLAFDNDFGLKDMKSILFKLNRDLSVVRIGERPCTHENEVNVSKTSSLNSNMNVDTCSLEIDPFAFHCFQSPVILKMR